MRPAIPALATALSRQVDGLSDRLLTSTAAANQTTTTGLDGRAVIDRWQQRRIGEHRRGRAEAWDRRQTWHEHQGLDGAQAVKPRTGHNTI